MAVAKFKFPQKKDTEAEIAPEGREASQAQGTAPEGREASQAQGTAPEGREAPQAQEAALEGAGGAESKTKSLPLKDIRKKADELKRIILTFERENTFKLSFYEKVHVILEKNDIRISEKELLDILTAALLAYKKKGGKT